MCSVRQVAYSTFTIIRITDNTTAEIIQFDNPNVILLRNGKSVDYPIVSRVIEGKTILESRIPLQLHDVFIAMSDGAIYAGVGKTMNFGWQRENIIEYAERLYDDTLSAKMIASMIVDECNRLYEGEPGDDTTVAAVRIRERTPVNLLMGWPQKDISPCLGLSSRETAWSVVVLPAPFAPISVTISPSFTSNEMPLMALMAP